ncbi:hypothetical protein CI109_102687 [Kwoniella shandongensis]|uniref:DNA polymerase delta subunit 3 n=1 Tax=Kwoniella shandongensis TaxID=1734106 RepID=A0A5M6BNU8_9TREE|nr:uncharacterized protein CI109_007113 [Kwoniella shandongensis]KAA5524566.1 hypothetical protein CI109_007113 [Kwoniella shandongensis]
MVSSEQQKTVTRKLTHWIENEKKIVTYRDVSREIGCHVNLAKNLLLEHFTSHPSLSPTYLLTGPLLRTSTLIQTDIPLPSSTLPSHSPTTGTQSLRDLAPKTGMVRIVDMDQTSDGGNSEHDDEDELREEEVGNDKGLLGEGAAGLGVGVGGAGQGGDEGGLEKEEVDRWGVVLVSQEGLEEKKKLFQEDQLSIHIYALAPAPVKDPAQYLIPNLALHQHPKYHDPSTYGTITGAGFKSAAGAGAKPMKDGGMDWSAGKKVEVKKVEDLKKVEKKEAPPPAAKEVAKKVETKKTTPAASSSTSKTAASQRNKKRVIQSDTEEDEEQEAPKPATKSSTSTPKSNTKASASSTGSGKKLQAEPTSSMVRQEDQAAMEAMMSMDVDMDMGMSDEGDAKTPSSTAKKGAKGKKEAEIAKVKKEPGAEGGRKKRRVKKTETVVNEKGYTVTRDVWVEEFYSGESDPEQEPSKATTQIKSKQTPTSTATSSKPPIKARDSTSSIGSNKEDKKPFSGGSSGGVKAKANSGKPATGQSTLKGFFTKK